VEGFERLRDQARLLGVPGALNEEGDELPMFSKNAEESHVIKAPRHAMAPPKMSECSGLWRIVGITLKIMGTSSTP
jgi:hypothetical protein